MAALFSYLLAIGIFIASGYAGLVWLANPPPDHPATHRTSSQPHRAESSNKNMHSERNSGGQRGEAANLPAASAKQQDQQRLAQANSLNGSEHAGSQQLTTGSSGSSKELARSSEQTQGERTPMSGQSCTPIGVTARGNLVFPMACREQLELHGRPGFSGNQSRATKNGDKAPQLSKVPAQRTAETIPEPFAPTSDPDLSRSTGSATRKVQSKSYETTAAIGRDRHPMRRARSSTRPTNAPERRTVVSLSNEWFNPLGLR